MGRQKVKNSTPDSAVGSGPPLAKRPPARLVGRGPVPGLTTHPQYTTDCTRGATGRAAGRGSVEGSDRVRHPQRWRSPSPIPTRQLSP
eukprot:14004-Prymnesium_polylepis.1